MMADPPYDQRLARALVRPLRHSPVTPNAVTASSLVVGLGAALAYAAGGWLVHLGALLFMLAFLLDHADGELARMTGRTSLFGHYFDLAAGGMVLIALFIGMGVGMSPGTLGGHARVLGALAGISIALIFILRLELERRNGKEATRQPAWTGFELEDVLYLLGPVTWLGALEPFLLLAGIGAPLYALHVVWTCRRLLPSRSGS
ncbi:MAG TPA: CDP-alcohol phosphatidyltransferase family protein [Geminicoccaceae bacterium]